MNMSKFALVESGISELGQDNQQQQGPSGFGGAKILGLNWPITTKGLWAGKFKVSLQ